MDCILENWYLVDVDTSLNVQDHHRYCVYGVLNGHLHKTGWVRRSFGTNFLASTGRVYQLGEPADFWLEQLKTIKHIFNPLNPLGFFTLNRLENRELSN